MSKFAHLKTLLQKSLLMTAITCDSPEDKFHRSILAVTVDVNLYKYFEITPRSNAINSEIGLLGPPVNLSSSSLRLILTCKLKLKCCD